MEIHESYEIYGGERKVPFVDVDWKHLKRNGFGEGSDYEDMDLDKVDMSSGMTSIRSIVEDCPELIENEKIRIVKAIEKQLGEYWAAVSYPGFVITKIPRFTKVGDVGYQDNKFPQAKIHIYIVPVGNKYKGE